MLNTRIIIIKYLISLVDNTDPSPLNTPPIPSRQASSHYHSPSSQAKLPQPYLAKGSTVRHLRHSPIIRRMNVKPITGAEDRQHISMKPSIILLPSSSPVCRRRQKRNGWDEVEKVGRNPLKKKKKDKKGEGNGRRKNVPLRIMIHSHHIPLLDHPVLLRQVGFGESLQRTFRLASSHPRPFKYKNEEKLPEIQIKDNISPLPLELEVKRTDKGRGGSN